jgi:hypothetical protein
MHCSSCGAAIAADARFCSGCGAVQVPAQPTSQPTSPIPPPGNWAAYRVQRHAQILGILWLVYSVWSVMAIMIGVPIAMSVLGRIAGDQTFPGNETFGAPFGIHLAMAVLPYLAVYVGLRSLLGVIAGIGVLTKKPWARVVAIIAAILSLIKIPFGTALGIYTLWALGNSEAYDAYCARP